jgi:hypothetical protein
MKTCGIETGAPLDGNKVDAIDATDRMKAQPKIT